MEKKGIATRQRVIEKSLQLFSVKGYFNTSIDDILKATDLTKGGLYFHFHSKEEIWNAVYEEASFIWRKIVFEGARDISDPLKRLERVIEKQLKDYIGGDVFEGGCFFLNSMLELTGQSSAMSRHILNGYEGFSRLFYMWLKEAEEKGMLKENINFDEVSNFLIVVLNGASALYTSSRDHRILIQTSNQLRSFINQLS